MLSLLAKMKVLLILEENRNYTFPVVRYFTWKLELVSDIFWVIDDRVVYLDLGFELLLQFYHERNLQSADSYQLNIYYSTGV